MYHKFIGIDIGKADFYVAIHGQKDVKVYPNNAAGFMEFEKKHLLELKGSLVVLETTGGYEKPLIRYLQSKDYAVHRANTRKVKHFIRSYGQLGKSDNIDALGLAQYANERHKSLSLFVESEQQELLLLVGRRDELKKMIVKEKNRLQAPEHRHLHSSYKTIIDALTLELKDIDGKIENLFKNSQLLTDKRKVLESVPGIGPVVSMQLVALMPEMGIVNRKQIASLAGVAPYPNESGKKIGYRFTKGGRKEVKTVLFMAAMAAARSNSKLGDDYNNFLDAGKKKMVALTAIMRKILVIANAKIRDYLLQKDQILAKEPL